MTKTKSTKRALLMSGLALLMCISMLVGSTFAWFTDSVTSGNNKIVAGNLDIALYKVDIQQTGIFPMPIETEITDSSAPLFDESIIWEPGYEAFANLKLVNEGNLAFKWNAVLRPTGEVGKLAEVIDVYTLRNENGTEIINAAMGREHYADDLNFVGTLKDVLAGDAILNGAFEEKDDFMYFSIVLKMREEAGNDYQGEVAGAFDITVLATQLAYEYDSFDNQYDSNLTVVTNAQELKNALAEGKTPVLPDGSIYEEPEDAIVVWDTQDLTSALKKANNGKTVFLAAGEYALPKITDAKVDGFTLVGTALVKITGMVDKTSAYKNFVFENIEFTGNVKGTFSGNSTIKNCTFTQAGLAPSCNVNASATLTIENCTFNGTGNNASLHFGGKDGGTLIIKDCVFNKGGVAFGKAMNIIFEECDFNGTAVECYGSYIFNNCTFDADAQVYIHPNTGATEVNLTMNGCSVDGGADVTSVCYNTGNNNGGVKTFTIDGKLYNHDELQAFPGN